MMATEKKDLEKDFEGFIDTASLQYISNDKEFIKQPVKKEVVEETRNKRLQLLIEPSKLLKLKLIAASKEISVNELVNQYITAGINKNR